MLKRKARGDEQASSGVSVDPATGLPDRRNLVPWLESAVERARADSSRVAVSFLALGDFHDISDTYGPEMADQLLATVGRRIMDALSSAQRFCRYYGAEFVVVTTGVNSAERAQELTEELLELLSEPVEVGPAQVSAITAAGVALSDSGYASIDEWVQDAHNALTEARFGGHRSCVLRDEATRNRIDVRITQERVLKGWDQNEFYVMYQPIVRAADNRIAGFEALLRWRDPGASGVFIPPNQFVYLLERIGLMVPVGEWILKQACAQVKAWNDKYADREPLFVSVNLGARQIAQNTFAGTVVSALDGSGLPRDLLVLDVTEEALRYNKAGTWNTLRGLKYLGVRASLDDFGIGEVGLNYLRSLQLDFLSIHRSFLEGIGQVEEDSAIVRAIVELGRALGIRTIAEGVETHDQDQRVRAIGPDYLQGYFYGRPELGEVTEETILDRGPMLEGSERWKHGISQSDALSIELAEQEGTTEGG